MAQENSVGTGESVPEDAQEQGTPDTEAPPAVPLNREQRRAQARGKSAPSGGSGLANRQGGSNSGVGNRASGSPGQVRFPRTGHK